MAKREYRVIVRDENFEICHTERQVAFCGDEAIRKFLSKYNIRGLRLKKFLDENKNKNPSEKMVYVIVYSHKNWPEIEAAMEDARNKGNLMPDYFNNYRHRDIDPPSDTLLPEQKNSTPKIRPRPKQIIKRQNIVISPKSPRPEDENKKMISDFAKNLFHHWKKEHKLGYDGTDYDDT
jgi:hypothetical protein